MNIALVGGHSEADFLISLLLKNENKLLIINEDEKYCHFLATKHTISSYWGDPSKQYVLDNAGIHNYDILIALTESDSDNLFICQVAKRLFKVKRVVCVVSNPKNVEVFKKLGVNTVISATYMVAQFIEQASTLEKLTTSLTIADNKIVISEVIIEEKYPIVGKKLFQLKLPQNTIISCLIRNFEMLVPNGQTEIQVNDHLLLLSSCQNQKETLSIITGEKVYEE